MSSVLRPVRKRKKGRTLGPVEIIRRGTTPTWSSAVGVDGVPGVHPGQRGAAPRVPRAGRRRRKPRDQSGAVESFN